MDLDAISIEAAKGWGGWSLFFLAVIWWVKGIPERRKVASDADAVLRADYGAHIDRLEEENEKLRDRLASLEREYEDHRRECRQETDSLHDLIRGLKKQVDGLQRDIAAHSQSTAMLLTKDGQP